MKQFMELFLFNSFSKYYQKILMQKHGYDIGKEIGKNPKDIKMKVINFLTIYTSLNLMIPFFNNCLRIKEEFREKFPSLFYCADGKQFNPTNLQFKNSEKSKECFLNLFIHVFFYIFSTVFFNCNSIQFYCNFLWNFNKLILFFKLYF